MRLLTIDIETSPSLAWVWGMWDQNVAPSQVREKGEVISFAAKWYGEKETYFYSVHTDGKEQMIQTAHDLLSEADAVIHYNGTAFDIKHLNREFWLLGLNPPAPFKQIDLLLTAKRRFKFTSNKLDEVANDAGLGRKTHHEGFGLWVKCMAGDEKAWQKMEIYNKRDVVLTEKLYDKLRAWIPVLPNAQVYDEDAVCTAPGCNSKELRREGVARLTAGTYQRYQCKKCGRWSRGKKRIGESVTQAGVVL